MSDSITTQIDTTSPVSDTTRAAAARVIQAMATDADLLLNILGLTGAGSTVISGRPCCPACHHPLRADRNTCRRANCPRGPKARAGAR